MNLREFKDICINKQSYPHVHWIPFCWNENRFYNHYLGPYISFFSFMPIAMPFIFMALSSNGCQFIKRSIYFVFLWILFFLAIYIQKEIESPRPFDECSLLNPFVTKYGIPLPELLGVAVTIICEIYLIYNDTISITSGNANGNINGNSSGNVLKKDSYFNYLKYELGYFPLDVNENPNVNEEMNFHDITKSKLKSELKRELKKIFENRRKYVKILFWIIISIIYTIIYYSTYLATVKQIVITWFLSFFSVSLLFFVVESCWNFFKTNTNV
jgi:hypothetical protein